jgi:hypothetical protein
MSLPAKCVVVLSQVTVLLGTPTAVFLLFLLSEGIVPTSMPLTLGSVENWPAIKNGTPEANSPADHLSNSPAALATPAIPESSRPLLGAPETPQEAALGSSPIVPASTPRLGRNDEENLEAQAPVDIAQPAITPPDQTADSNTEAQIGSLEAAAVTSALQNKNEPARGSVDNAKAMPEPQDNAAQPQTSSKVAAQQATAPRPRSPTSSNLRSARRQSESNSGRQRIIQAQRPRDAAEEQQASSQNVASPLNSAEESHERVRILGIPMPTGSEIKECLLEFRC